MKLMCETTENFEVITEANDKGGKDYFIEGIFLQGNIKNRNGRIYPTDVLANEVKRYTAEQINTNRAYGELGHPDGPTINLDRASHLIKEIKQDGDNFIGKAKILSTPMGNIVRNLLDDGANLGVSSRGLGTLKSRSGIMEVQSDFRLATAADIVADPSAPSAFVQGIMENVEWILDAVSGNWYASNQFDIVEDTVKREMKRNSLSESKKASLFEQFISSLL